MEGGLPGSPSPEVALNEDTHLEAAYEDRFANVDEEGDEVCEECEEIIDDCRCCPDCGSADCDWDCEQEE